MFNRNSNLSILQCYFNGHALATLVVAGTFQTTGFWIAVISWGFRPLIMHALWSGGRGKVGWSNAKLWRRPYRGTPGPSWTGGNQLNFLKLNSKFRIDFKNLEFIQLYLPVCPNQLHLLNFYGCLAFFAKIFSLAQSCNWDVKLWFNFFLLKCVRYYCSSVMRLVVAEKPNARNQNNQMQETFDHFGKTFLLICCHFKVTLLWLVSQECVILCRVGR